MKINSNSGNIARSKISSIDNTRVILRQKVGIRLIFFLMGIGCILVYWFIMPNLPNLDKDIINMFMGFMMSIWAWSITDIVVFVVEIVEKYKIERDEFLRLTIEGNKKIIKRLLKLRENEKTPAFVSILKGKTNKSEEIKIAWNDIRNEVDDLMHVMYEFQYKSGYYVLSVEFKKYFNYLNRFYYILLANFRGEEADFENIFNKVFIYRNDIVKTDGIDEINAIQRHSIDIDDVYDDMKKNLILDELPYNPPDCIIETKYRSVISKYCYIDLPHDKKITYTLIFKPYQYLESMLCLDIHCINKYMLIKELLSSNNDV